MLVLTRREGEELVIGDPKAPTGTIRVVRIDGDRVRIALDFPREIDIHRRELVPKVLKERAVSDGC